MWAPPKWNAVKKRVRNRTLIFAIYATQEWSRFPKLLWEVDFIVVFLPLTSLVRNESHC